MTFRCEREEELLDCLERDFLGPDLASHVRQCTSCSELHNVAGGLLDERVQAMSEASVPTAATMWWRLQLRHRHEAQAKARRSLLIGQAVTLTIAITLIGSFFGADLAAGFREAMTAVRLSTPLLVGVATTLLLAPIAGYVAMRQK